MAAALAGSIELARRTFLISVWFIGSFFLTYPGVAYIEESVGGLDGPFNALIFLPHGVRVFAIWLFRHQAIIPLLVAHALHIYGGNFREVQPERSLWSHDRHEQKGFSFPAMLQSSISAMKDTNNQSGLEAFAAAIPKVRPLIEA